MQFDLSNDLVIIFGWGIGLSTLLIWLSAMLGFMANMLYNRHMYLAMYKEGKLSELSYDAFVAIEKIAKLTPMQSDDKLLEYLKLSFRAFKQTFGTKPSLKDVQYLERKARAYADENKITKPVPVPVPVPAIKKPVIKKPVSKKPVSKKR